MKTHLQGAFAYRARIGVKVHYTVCGTTNSLAAPTSTNLALVTCKACLRSHRARSEAQR